MSERASLRGFYVGAVAIATLALVVSCAVVDRDRIAAWEGDLTTSVNRVPDWTALLLWPVMQLGTVLAVVVIAVVVGVRYGGLRGVAVAASGLLARQVSSFIKDTVERGRPEQYLPGIDVREGTDSPLGFVSGHTAVAFAIAMALVPILSPRARVAAFLLATLVGLARIVYGVHLPLDVVGGAAVGVLSACVVELGAKAVSDARMGRRE